MSNTNWPTKNARNQRKFKDSPLPMTPTLEEWNIRWSWIARKQGWDRGYRFFDHRTDVALVIKTVSITQEDGTRRFPDETEVLRAVFRGAAMGSKIHQVAVYVLSQENLPYVMNLMARYGGKDD